MPELPEVETVKNSLKNYVLNRKILKVDVLYKGIINYPSVKEFIEKITNQTILDVKRRGKYLVFVLEDYNLISHLKILLLSVFLQLNPKILLSHFSEPMT